ncbi:MAG: SMUG2 DNA glycosylase family protein [Bacteroides sp.]|jgi:hypothetical protein|nr:SMUG2 DNA glycosylase family protein [Bacteroides sp.]
MKDVAMETFAERVIAYNTNLNFDQALPDGIRVMNPFRENPEALEVSSAFYRKYYNDQRQRHLILGINPGRFGAGVTGIPFTDTKRLVEKCGLQIRGISTHEPSSVFVYEVIDAYGGVDAFYGDFYINSVSPLGFVRINERGKEVNYNYYDDPKLQASLYNFMLQSVRTHISMGIHTDVCFCLGSGKNFRFLEQMNREHDLFKKIIPLDHPRFVVQYRSKQMPEYVKKFVTLLKRK